MEYLQESHFAEGLCNVINDGKYGFIDRNGQIIVPFLYDWGFEFSESLAAVSINEKYGYINRNNEVIIPFEYDFASCFVNGFAWVMKNGKKGFINKQGIPVTDFIYDTVTYTDDDTIIVTTFNDIELFGMLDLDLKEILPCVFQSYEKLLDYDKN